MSKEKPEIPEYIRERYFFKTVSKPDGEIIHPTHCAFFTHHICTCGLLVDLIRCVMGPRIYPKLHEQYAEHLAALEKTLPQIPEEDPKKRGKRGCKDAGKAQRALLPDDAKAP